MDWSYLKRSSSDKYSLILYDGIEDALMRQRGYTFWDAVGIECLAVTEALG
jgi:hypothetical protein